MSQPADRILVINPNSTEAVTAGIDKAMEPLRIPGGPAIECVTLAEGPPGIETQAHVESVVAPISATVRSRDNDCSAFVIACYSDPGLHAARETAHRADAADIGSRETLLRAQILRFSAIGQKQRVAARKIPADQRRNAAAGTRDEHAARYQWRSGTPHALQQLRGRLRDAQQVARPRHPKLRGSDSGCVAKEHRIGHRARNIRDA